MNFQPLSPEELVTRLSAIVDSSEDAIIGTDEHDTINAWNSAAETLFGFTAGDILGQSILLLVPPDLHEEHREKMDRLRNGERVEHYESHRLRKGGQRLDLSIAMSPIRNADGRLIGSAVIVREMSARRREEALRARLAAIVESSDEAIIANDMAGVITDWNSGAERLFGYTAQEIIGRSILTIIPSDLQHEEHMILGKLRAGKRVEHYETEHLHKSGARLQISASMSPICDSSGRVIGASKIARDVSERRRLENARLFLAAIVESSDDAIISKNLDGIITSWNTAAERLFGYKAEEIIGQSVLRIIPRELHVEEPHIISKLRNGERIEHYETRRMKKNGQVIEVSLTVSPIRDETGRVIGGSKILRDIRDRKAAEAALVEKEKFAAAGRLAATLAHEVNNPLESITNLAYLLSQNSSLDAEAKSYSELLLKEVQRAGEITRATLGYYRQSKSAANVNLEQVVEHVLKAKRKKLDEKNIGVEAILRDIPEIRGFAGELRQVFDNLIDNAIDAVPLDGHIVVNARLENSRVLVSVCDNGSGISSDSMPHIFEPFFTTKSEKGSGLGLWVSRAIVEKHGGSIRVHTKQNPSKTVFTVDLPVAGVERPQVVASTGIKMHLNAAMEKSVCGG